MRGRFLVVVTVTLAVLMTLGGLPVPADGPGPTGDTPGPVPLSLVGDGSDRTYLPAEIESVQELLTMDFSERLYDVDWSPDGKYLAVGGRTSSGGGPFRLFSFNGTALTTVVSWTDRASVSAVEWSPNGSYLAYNVVGSGNSLKVFSFNGTALQEVASASFSHVIRFAWSPDGRYLAATGWDYTSTLSVYSFNGTALSVVDERDYRSFGYSVAWDAEGTHLALAWRYEGSGFPFVEIGKFVIYSFDGSSLTEEWQADMGRSAQSVAWSPDGDHLALAYSGDWPDYPVEVYQVYEDLSGDLVMDLKDSFNFRGTTWETQWSPNGHYLATGGSSMGHDCRINSFDGSSFSAVDSWSFGGGAALSLDWSPDGRYMAFGGMDGARDLKVYRVDYGLLSTNDTMMVDEDTRVTLDVLANDRTTSGDLTITNVTPASRGLVEITADGRDLLFTPPANWSGNDSLTYRHSDMLPGSLSASVNITVTPVNDVPVITTADVVVATEDEEYSVLYEAKDADPDDNMTWSFDTDAEWLSFDEGTGLLTGTPTNDHVGSYLVEVTVTDTNATVDTHSFLLTVVNVNDAPAITSADVTDAEEDSLYSSYYLAMDVDPTHDVLAWSLDTDAGWLSIHGNHLTGTPTNDDVGEHVVNVSVSDGNGGSAWTEFTITVANTNDAPRILTTPSTVATEDEGHSQTFEAEDVDAGDVLSWSMTGPAWLAIDEGSGVLAGTPGNDDVGTHGVTVTVRDGALEDALSFTITVENTNDAPVWLSTPGDQALMEGDPMFLDVLAEDEDGDRLTYGLTSTPSSGMRINPATGAIRWMGAVPGTYEVQLTVTDGTETITHDLTVAVEEEPEPPIPPPNKVPVIGEVVVDNATAGEAFTLSLTGSDADPWDAGNLTFALVSGPAGMVVSANGAILWLPTEDQVGTHPVIISLSDSKNATTLDFDVEVVEADDGDGVEAESDDTFKWLAIALLIVVLVLVVLMVMMYRNQG